MDNEISIHTALPEIKRVLLNAQDWYEMSEICCASETSEAEKGQLASVKAKQYGGFLYAVPSVLHGARSGNHVANAWQLLPESLYQGEAIDAVNWPKVHAEKRYGYGYEGLRVKVTGQIMVMVKPVDFVRGLPTVPPLSLEMAEAFDKDCRSAGWRSHMFGEGSTITWHKLAGHPVVVYEKEGREPMATLLWKYQGRIHDHYLHTKVEGFSFDTDTTPEPSNSEPETELASKTFGTRKKRNTEADLMQGCLF